MAQLVEHNLAKVGVAGSSPVVRSIAFPDRLKRSFFGEVAKWLGRGLQSLYPRFESGLRLQATSGRSGARFVLHMRTWLSW